MGTKISKQYKPPTLNTHNWHHQPHPKRIPKPEHGPYLRLVNTLTNEQVQEYSILFNELAELQKYIDLFSWREREECIVNTRYFNLDENKEFCNTTYRAKVYIDHMAVRLSDIQDIPYPENLYLLFSSLQGFQKLYQIVGYFQIVQDFICMDKDGKVKVWYNSDLSKCTLSLNHSSSIDECRSDFYQQKMVDQIVRMIEENTTEDSQAEMGVSDYLKLKYKGKGVSFRKCKQEIINYAQKYKVDIPNYFQSVIGIFDEIDNEKSSPQLGSEQIKSNGFQPAYGNQVQVYNSGSIINRNNQQEKLTNAANSFESFNRVPSYQYMMNKEVEQRPYSSFFSNQYQAQNRQKNYMSTYYPRAQSPIDKLPPMLPNSFNFSYNGIIPQSMQKRSEATKSASFHMPTIASPSLNKQLPIHSSTAALHSNNFPPHQTSKGLKGSVSLRDLFIDKRLMYSDSKSSYELDGQLIEDMIRYQFF